MASLTDFPDQRIRDDGVFHVSHRGHVEELEGGASINPLYVMPDGIRVDDGVRRVLVRAIMDLAGPVGTSIAYRLGGWSITNVRGSGFSHEVARNMPAATLRVEQDLVVEWKAGDPPDRTLEISWNFISLGPGTVTVTRQRMMILGFTTA